MSAASFRELGYTEGYLLMKPSIDSNVDYLKGYEEGRAKREAEEAAAKLESERHV